MWAFKTLWDKGLIYEGFRVLAYCWRCETPLSQHRDPDGRHLPRPPGPGADRLVPAGDRRADPRVDDDPVDAAVEPRARGRRRHRLRGRSSSTASGTSSPTRCSAPTRPSWRRRAGRHDARRRPVGRRYEPLFDFFTDAATRHRAGVPGARRPTSCRSRTAPASSTWRPGSARTTRSPATRPASRRSARWTSTAATPPRSRRGRDPRVRRQPDGDPGAQGRGVVVRHASYDHSYPHCWRCDQPLVYRAISSWFVEVTKFRDRMVELNQEITWRPRTSRRAASASGWRTPATGRSAATASGGRRSRCGKSDDPTYPRVDVYGSLAELRGRLRRRGHRPPPPVVDDSCARTPTTRPGSR